MSKEGVVAPPTPGPWVAKITDGKRGMTAQVFTLWDGPEDADMVAGLLGCTEADAHLIAAAPDLLEAAEQALREPFQFVGKDALREAVRKAKGES